ncbi:hypothetical protein Hdeb2414_s0027g00690551 [Helianthus debilis subsp. tardiflorus]
MGDFRLKINVARFSVENSGGTAKQENNTHQVRTVANNNFGGNSNLRDARSYRDVVGSSRAAGGSSAVNIESKELREKVIVVPDRTGAFNNLVGVALVGRTVDLETLVDFDRLLKIAKLTVANFQYLGIWSPWFSKLDPWRGQTLPLERVAWLKLSGIPIHLFYSEVMGQIGELFGKILHVPKFFEEEQDLSIARVGVLVGSSNSIKEEVSLRWRDRTFRVWVEEDQEIWVPDCFGRDDCSELLNMKSSETTPDVDMQDSGTGEKEENQPSDAGGEAEEPQAPNVTFPHVDLSPGHVEREKGGAENVQGPVVESFNVEGIRLGSKVVGPEVVMGFKCGSGGRCNRTKRRGVLGLKSTKAQSQSKGNKERSPDDVRPKKRSRNFEKDDEPGFGFVGFTSRTHTQLDLNIRAQSSETLAADSLSQGNRYMEALLRNQGGVSNEELVATIEIGAQMGVDFGSNTEQVNKNQGTSGINEVEI